MSPIRFSYLHLVTFGDHVRELLSFPGEKGSINHLFAESHLLCREDLT